MNVQWKLVILILALTLDDQVHTGEIIGGHEATPHSRPYMVLLKMTQSDKTKYCGGFLLNEDFVMTAAHCQAESYTLFLGVHNANKKDDKQKVSVEQAFPHEGYDDTDGYKNDIMLLKMSAKAQINENVKPVDLADEGGDSLPQSCTVSGWGATNSIKKHMSLTLMEINVTLIEKCVAEKSYCSQGNIGPGSGDSGGPLVCEDGKAYGVVSSAFTPPEGGPKIYTYAKISDYREWINEKITEF